MLRDYQNELIVKTREAYKQGFNRPCIVLPCGGGGEKSGSYKTQNARVK